MPTFTDMSDIRVTNELCRIIRPTNPEELAEAFQIKADTQMLLDSRQLDEEQQSLLLGWLKEQQAAIDQYTALITEFDNSIFLRNIKFLTDKYHLRMGDIERMLGISAGYISRTAKESSGKKMSLDNTVRIAKLFNVDLQELIEEDLSMPASNNELAISFMNRALSDTKASLLTWQCEGGYACAINERLVNAGLIREEDYDSQYNCYYLPLDYAMRRGAPFHLAGEVFSTRDFSEQSIVIVIPYKHEGVDDETTYFDFLLLNTTDTSEAGNSDQSAYSMLFSTYRIPLGTLDEPAMKLYREIASAEFETTMSHSAKDFIAGYLRGGKK